MNLSYQLLTCPPVLDGKNFNVQHYCKLLNQMFSDLPRLQAPVNPTFTDLDHGLGSQGIGKQGLLVLFSPATDQDEVVLFWSSSSWAFPCLLGMESS